MSDKTSLSVARLAAAAGQTASERPSGTWSRQTCAAFVCRCIRLLFEGRVSLGNTRALSYGPGFVRQCRLRARVRYHDVTIPPPPRFFIFCEHPVSEQPVRSEQ